MKGDNDKAPKVQRPQRTSNESLPHEPGNNRSTERDTRAQQHQHAQREGETGVIGQPPNHRRPGDKAEVTRSGHSGDACTRVIAARAGRATEQNRNQVSHADADQCKPDQAVAG
jgi:hypothetical protein